MFRKVPLRKRDFDYSSVGSYFITIKTHNGINFFGEKYDIDVKLSRIGEIASDCWKEIPKHIKNIEIDSFIIMPNHLHGIIHIVTDEKLSPVVQDHRLALQGNRINQKLPIAIRQYKSSVTRLVKK